jgi:hypothetical protein
MARIGTGIRPELGRIDYTPFLQGSLAGSQAIGRGLAGLGEAFGGAIQEYSKKKEERDTYASLFESKVAELERKRLEASQNPQLYGDGPIITEEQINSFKNMGDARTPALKAKIAEADSLIKNIDEAPARTLRTLQIGEAQRASAAAIQTQKNQDALGKALAGIPETVADRRIIQPSQNPELFPFAEGNVPSQLPQAKQPSSVVVTPPTSVVVTPPPGVAEFVFRDTPAKQYTFKSDIADAMVREQEDLVNRNQAIIKSINDRLSANSVPVAGVAGVAGPGPASGFTTRKLLPSEREQLVGSFDAAQASLNAETERLNALKKRVDEAKKFEGTPLERPVDQQVVDQASKAIAGGDNEEAQKISRVMSANFKNEQRSYEETVQRPLTAAEKYKVALSTYLSEGGTITPDAKRQIESFTRDKVEVIRVGGLSAVRIGDNDNWQIVKPPTESVSGKKYDDEKEYYDLIGIAASGGGINSLSIPDRNRLSELYERFARINPVSGLIPDLDSLIVSRRGRVFGDSMDQNITPAPATNAEQNKPGNTKTIGGVNYVYKNGGWVKI